MNGNFVINGNNALVYAHNGNFTINGSNDTLISANAVEVVITGNHDFVTDLPIPGINSPIALMDGAGEAIQDQTPGAVVSITGANDTITIYNNNNTIQGSGNNTSVDLLSYGNDVTISGSGSDVTAQDVDENISVGGADDTVTTATSPVAGPSSSAVPNNQVNVSSVSSSSFTYNDGSPTIISTVAGSGRVNVTSGGTDIVATVGGTYYDSVGGNGYTIGGGAKVDLSSGNNTITFSDRAMPVGDTLSGTASSPDTIILGSGSVINFTSAGTTSNYDVLSRHRQRQFRLHLRVLSGHALCRR